MRIEIDKLEGTGGKFSQVYEIDELPLGEPDIRLTAQARVDGQARREGSEIEMQGAVEAQVEIACGRCLKAVELPIRIEFDERFVPAVAWRNEEQHELKADDLNLAVLRGEGIDLDELVREQILLAVPGHVLCSEDCKGLCPVCAIDRNRKTCNCEETKIDPRWRKLKEMQM